MAFFLLQLDAMMINKQRFETTVCPSSGGQSDTKMVNSYCGLYRLLKDPPLWVQFSKSCIRCWNNIMPDLVDLPAVIFVHGRTLSFMFLQYGKVSFIIFVLCLWLLSPLSRQRDRRSLLAPQSVTVVFGWHGYWLSSWAWCCAVVC